MHISMMFEAHDIEFFRSFIIVRMYDTTRHNDLHVLHLILHYIHSFKKLSVELLYHK